MTVAASMAALLLAAPLQADVDAGGKLLPNVTSRWEGELVQDPDPLKGAGQLISFTVTTNAGGEVTAVDAQITARTATLVGEEVSCFSGGLVGTSVGASAPFIFPSGDGFAATGARALAGEFLTAVGFGVQLEVGEVPGFGTVGENQALGSVQYTYTHRVEGATRNSPCNWIFEAMCVENCEGGGLFGFAVASVEVREAAGFVEITVLRNAASMGEVTVDYATSDGTATAGEDYTAQSGTLTFADGETSMIIQIPIAVNTPFEGPETFMLALSNPQGGAQLGSPTTAEVIIDDRPDLSIDPFSIAATDLVEENGRFLIKDLSLVVRNNAVDGESVDGAQIDITDNGTFMLSDNLGPLAPGASETFTFDYDATSAIQAADGDGTFTVTAVVDEPDAFPETDESNNTQADDSTIDVTPKITLVDPRFTLDGAFFLADQSVTNPVPVQVDWNGDLEGLGTAPFGTVTYDLNGVPTVRPGSLAGATRTYDMGSDFIAELGCDGNTLVIFAEQNGFISPQNPMTSPNTTVFDVPDWVEWASLNIPGADAEFTVLEAPPVVNYEYNFAFPEEPFELTTGVPDGIPVFGGGTVGILATSAMVKAKAASDGQASLRLNGMTGVAVGVGQVLGSVLGEGQVQYDCVEGLDLVQATFGLSITGQITRSQGLIEVFPGISVAHSWPIVGDLIEWLSNTAMISGEIGPRIAVEATFRDDPDGTLRFDSSIVEAGLPTSATLAIQPIEDILLSVSGGGEPYVRMIFSSDPTELDQVGVILMVTAILDIYGFGGEFEQAVNCLLPGGCTIAKGPKGPPTAPELLPRDYFGPTYSQFDGTALANDTLRAPDSETRLIAEAFPRLTAALSPGSGSTDFWVVATFDDPADSAGRGTEIHGYALSDGTWSGPFPITADEQGDFGPAVAVDADGDPVVVWERSTLEAGLTPEIGQAYAQTFEIFWSTFEDGSWSVPEALTMDTMMDQGVQLVERADGSLLALWRSHSGADMTGSVSDPVTLLYALWDGDAWSTPQVAAAGLVDLLQLSLAAGDGEDAVVFSQRSGTPAKGFDPSQIDLAYLTFDGSTWSAPAGLTSDAVADSSPTVAYDADGDRHILWVRDGELVWLENSFDAANAVMLDDASGAAGFLGLRAAADGDGNLALVYQSSAGGGNNLAFRTFEDGAGSWGSPVMLGTDLAIEGRHRVAFDAGGDLSIVYAKTGIELVDELVDDGLNPAFTVENMPQTTTTDLVFFKRASGSDLAVRSVTVAPGDVQAGEDFTADVVITNQGDDTVTGQVLVELDDLSIGTDSGSLAPGESLTIQVMGRVAADGSTLRATADSADAVSEVNETNNVRAVELGRPTGEVVFSDGFEQLPSG